MWAHKEHQTVFWSLSLVWLQHKWEQGNFMKTYTICLPDWWNCVLGSNDSIFPLLFLAISLSFYWLACHLLLWNTVSFKAWVLNNSWPLDLFPAFPLSNCWPQLFSEMLLFWNGPLLFCPEESWKTVHVQTTDKQLYRSMVFIIFCSSQLIFRDHLLQAQEWSIPLSRKSSGRKPVWTNKMLLTKLKHQKEAYKRQRHGRVTWKEYRENVQICRYGVRKAKVHLEINLTGDM